MVRRRGQPERDLDLIERARVVAKIERGLEDVKLGRVVPHAEVMARFEARYGREL